MFSERFLSYFGLHVAVTTIMSTVLGKYSHLVSCDSSKLCRERKKENCTKVNRQFLYIIIAPNVLYLSVLVARLVVSAFISRLLDEHLLFCSSPLFLFSPSLWRLNASTYRRDFTFCISAVCFYVGVHQTHVVLVASSASLLCTCNIASSMCCNSEVTFRLMVLL